MQIRNQILQADRSELYNPPFHIVSHQDITPELMEKVYGLACDVITDPVSQSPMVLPKGRHYASAAI